MSSRRPLAVLLAVLAPALIAGALRAQDAATAARPPNIVVLFVDDAGYADFGFQRAPHPDLAARTPHIDSIAHAGVRFTDAYVSGCVCSPSRAGLTTGRYQQRFGHERNIPQGYMKGGMALAEHTVADRLGALGLTTALIGKWHLGYPDAYHPNRRGYAWFEGLLQGSRSYFPIAKPSPHRVIQRNGEALPEVGYVTDRLGTAAVEYIEAHAAAPFFLFVSFTAPHGPLEAKDDDLELLSTIEPLRRRKYCGLVKALDDAVGRILATLHERGLDERTLVVFTNDNGGQTLTGAINTPLRGKKGELWEGGIRVPMAMRWPGHIEAGTTIGDPVITLDFLPTFVAAVGGTCDPQWRLDGIDLGPRVHGAVDALPERPLFWRSQGSKGPVAMRLGRFKLLIERGEGDEAVHLFDLAADIGEAHDLAADDPERVRAMRAAIAAWEAELIEPLWGGGDD